MSSEGLLKKPLLTGLNLPWTLLPGHPPCDILSSPSRLIKRKQNRIKLLTIPAAFFKADLDSSERPWLKKGIVVKIVTKSLGEKYYKAKGHIKEVVGDDRMAAVVVLNNGGGKVKLDQVKQNMQC